MTHAPESVYPASVDHTEFRATLDRLGLSQADLMRLLAYLRDDATDRVTVNRWAIGRRPVPPGIVAILRLWEMLPQKTRQKVLKEASGYAASSSSVPYANR